MSGDIRVLMKWNKKRDVYIFLNCDYEGGESANWTHLLASTPRRPGASNSATGVAVAAAAAVGSTVVVVVAVNIGFATNPDGLWLLSTMRYGAGASLFVDPLSAAASRAAPVFKRPWSAGGRRRRRRRPPRTGTWASEPACTSSNAMQKSSFATQL